MSEEGKLQINPIDAETIRVLSTLSDEEWAKVLKRLRQLYKFQTDSMLEIMSKLGVS